MFDISLIRSMLTLQLQAAGNTLFREVAELFLPIVRTHTHTHTALCTRKELFYYESKEWCHLDGESLTCFPLIPYCHPTLHKIPFPCLVHTHSFSLLFRLCLITNYTYSVFSSIKCFIILPIYYQR